MGPVMIIGGGVGGLGAALALDAAGYDVTVYEAHPTTGADIGAFLTLASNGMRALAQVNAAAPVTEAGFELTELAALDASGTERGVAPLTGHADPLTRYRCLRRADLCAVLHTEAERRGIQIVHGKRLTGVEEDANGITAVFTNGGAAREAGGAAHDAGTGEAGGAGGAAPTTAREAGAREAGAREAGAREAGGAVRTTAREASQRDAGTREADTRSTARGALLVAADGLNSPTRTLLNPGGEPPRYAGQQVFYGYTPELDPLPAEGPRITMIAGSATAFGYAVSPAGETYWFARVPGDPLTPDQTAAGPDVLRAALEPLLRPDATPAADIVSAATGLMATNAYDLPEVPRWRTPRTLLLGDAAHAASPATGQGASMALEDAIVLAKALRAEPLPDALATYERVRRPRVTRNITASARLTATRPEARREEGPRVTFRDEDPEVIRLLDWNTPLPA